MESFDLALIIELRLYKLVLSVILFVQWTGNETEEFNVSQQNHR